MTIRQLSLATMFVLLAVLSIVKQNAAFQVTRTSFVARQRNVDQMSSTTLYGLLGRFRKNRKVDQVATIKVGDKLPVGVDVERILTLSDNNGEQLSEPVAIQDVLGSNKALLIGM